MLINLARRPRPSTSRRRVDLRRRRAFGQRRNFDWHCLHSWPTTMTWSANDVTPLPDLVHGHEEAGPMRTRRPIYVDLIPPCNVACPAGEDSQAWLSLVRSDHYEAAWRALTRDNPLPTIHGRVCYHPCEQGCNRAELDTRCRFTGSSGSLEISPWIRAGSSSYPRWKAATECW